MDQAAWLAHFAEQRRAAWERYEAEQRAFRERVAADIEVEKRAAREALERPAPPSVVILEPGREFDPLGAGELIGDAARRVAVGAVAHGWGMRAVRSKVVGPTRGVVDVVSVRFWRHDERGWAAWHTTPKGWSMEAGWARSATRGLEQLVASRMSTQAKRGRIIARSPLDLIEGIQIPASS